MSGTQKSVEARGFAARARDVGVANNVAGFEKGTRTHAGGPDRVAANHIVHAPIGEARNHLGTAQDLHGRAGKN